MRKVKIITDSCADLSAEQLEKYDIDYARMSTIEDGKESPALLTWTPAEAHRLYETIRGGKRITTAQVSVEEFKSCLKNIWGFISWGLSIQAFLLFLDMPIRSGTASKAAKDFSSVFQRFG